MLKHKAKWASSVEEYMAAPAAPPAPSARSLGENHFTACFNCLREDDLMRYERSEAASRPGGLPASSVFFFWFRFLLSLTHPAGAPTARRLTTARKWTLISFSAFRGCV
jgi:hypothetical protein